METTLEIVATIKHLLKMEKVDIRDHRTVTENMLGEYMAYRLELPASPVADMDIYFRNYCKVQCLEKLAQINEHLVFDLDAACNLALALWRIRYRLVHRPDHPSAQRLFHMCIQTNIADQRHVDALIAYPNAFFNRAALAVQPATGVN